MAHVASHFSGGMPTSSGSAMQVGGSMGASQGQWNLAAYPDARPTLMSRSEAENATKQYLGIADGMPPAATDRAMYTDKAFLENFDQTQNSMITFWLRDNFERADSSWHFVFAPITFSEVLEYTDHMVTVNRTLMDPAAPQAVPSFVTIEEEQHLGKLNQFIKGAEIDGDAFFNTTEGNATYWKYILAVSQSAILTAKAAVAAGVLNDKSYFVEWTRRFGDANMAITAYDAVQNEINKFGMYAYDDRAIYKTIAEAKMIGETEGVSYDLIVMPPGRLTLIAHSKFESGSAATRGTMRQEQRLTNPVESWTSEFKRYKFMEDMKFCLYDREPIYLGVKQVWLGRFLFLDGNMQARTARDLYDADRDGTLGYIDMMASEVASISLKQCYSKSIYFNEVDDDDDGAISSYYRDFVNDVNNNAWLSKANLTGRQKYIGPYSYHDANSDTFVVVAVNGDRDEASASLDHAQPNGRLLRERLLKEGVVTLEQLRHITAAIEQLKTFAVCPDAERKNRNVQLWFQECASSNAYADSDMTADPTLEKFKVNRFGGFDLPASAKFDDDKLPAMPYGWSTVPCWQTLVTYYRQNASDLKSFKPWKTFFEVLDLGLDPLKRIYNAVRSTFSKNQGFLTQDLRLQRTGNAAADEFNAFATNYIDADKAPLMFSLENDFPISAAKPDGARNEDVEFELFVVDAVFSKVDEPTSKFQSVFRAAQSLLPIDGTFKNAVLSANASAKHNILSAFNLMATRYDASNELPKFIATFGDGSEVQKDWMSAAAALFALFEIAGVASTSNNWNGDYNDTFFGAKARHVQSLTAASRAKTLAGSLMRNKSGSRQYSPSNDVKDKTRSSLSLDGAVTIEFAKGSVTSGSENVPSNAVKITNNYKRRVKHLEGNVDWLEKLGALLWLDSPCTAGQRSRNLQCGLAHDAACSIIQPDILLLTAPDMFLVQNSAKTLYKMPLAEVTFDRLRHKLIVRATIWMGYRNPKHTNTLILNDRHYVGYCGGGDKIDFYTNREAYEPNAHPRDVAHNAFCVEHGASTTLEHMPPYFSIQGSWEGKYFSRDFAQLASSNTLNAGMCDMLYPIWFWNWHTRNSLVEPTRVSYAAARDNVMLNVAVGLCSQFEHVAGTPEWRQRQNATTLTKNIGPGCRQVFEGSGDLMPNLRDQPVFLRC